MKYKAIVSDIDGTLTQKMSSTATEPLPSHTVKSAIASLNGIVQFVLATSRPLPRVAYLFNHLQLSGPQIILNGAQVIDGKTHHVLVENLFPIEELTFLSEYFSAKKVSFVIDERDAMEIPFTKSYQPHNPLTVFVSELTDEQAFTIENDLSKRSSLSLHRVPSWSNHLWGFSICHVNASKQHAVLEVSRLLNIKTEEMIGIGDHYNDFSLLMACGLKVAMGNAVDDLKAIADYIAPSVEEDGVADVIKKFILNA